MDFGSLELIFDTGILLLFFFLILLPFWFLLFIYLFIYCILSLSSLPFSFLCIRTRILKKNVNKKTLKATTNKLQRIYADLFPQVQMKAIRIF